MTTFDLIVFAIFALSVSFAVIRGAMRELGALAALAGAALGALFLTRPLQGLAGAGDSFVATASIAAGLIIVIFCALSVGFHIAFGRIRLTGPTSRLDRVGGGLFGLLRGLVLIGLGFLAYSYYLDEDRWPDSVNRALTLPLAKGLAGFFEGFAPESTQLDSKPDAAPAEEVDAALEGYDGGERAALAEIMATATTTESMAESDTPEDRNDPIADVLKESEPQ